METQILVNLGSGNGLLSGGTKPLLLNYFKSFWQTGQEKWDTLTQTFPLSWIMADQDLVRHKMCLFILLQFFCWTVVFANTCDPQLSSAVLSTPDHWFRSVTVTCTYWYVQVPVTSDWQLLLITLKLLKKCYNIMMSWNIGMRCISFYVLMARQLKSMKTQILWNTESGIL